jgi:hypothetical protein
MAVSFSQMLAAQPEQAGATVIHQRGTQNSSQIGTDNQSTQVYGNENQTTTQNGAQPSNDTASQARAATGGVSSDAQEKRGNKGKHKGWEKNRHGDGR